MSATTTTTVAIDADMRVNLMPTLDKKAAGAKRSRSILIIVAVVCLALAISGYVLQQVRVSQAANARDAAQADVAASQAREAQLAEWGQLEQGVLELERVVAIVMYDEVAVSRLLTDVQLVTPPVVTVNTFQLTLGEGLGPQAGELRTSLGRMAMTGTTPAGLSPSIRQVLVDYGDQPQFFNVFAVTAQLEDDEADDLAFTFEVDLGEEARTGSYDSGPPTTLELRGGAPEADTTDTDADAEGDE